MEKNNYIVICKSRVIKEPILAFGKSKVMDKYTYVAMKNVSDLVKIKPLSWVDAHELVRNTIRDNNIAYNEYLRTGFGPVANPNENVDYEVLEYGEGIRNIVNSFSPDAKGEIEIYKKILNYC